MNKKYASIFVALVLAVSSSLAACGGTPPGIAPQSDDYGTTITSSAADSSSSESSQADTSSTESTSAEDSSSSEITASAVASSSDSGDYSYQKNSDGTIAMNYGAILHAFAWDFKTITENLQDIKDAGYTSIQTSPINQCKVGDSGGRALYSEGEGGKWYYHYQPVDYVIGNYQLGTEADFKKLCEEAKKLGLKIIVDVPLNHTTGDENAITQNVLNICENPFHGRGEIASYSSRKQVTQNDLLGLKDLNTQDKAVQEYLLTYLKSCIADGASGFRFDAAKHIELPDDDEEYASDFWPTILDNGAEFQYGEILQGDCDRFADYAEIMNVTASSYGSAIKSATQGVVSTSAVEPYMANQVDPSKLVTWVESHDNYCNESESSWRLMNEADVELGWAIIAARSGGAPLFFSRPHGSTEDNPWGDNLIGAAGSDGYKSANVSALNHFRNEMAGLGEKLSNPDEDKHVLMIERGDKGAVIINAGEKDYELSGAETVLADGTYKDKVTNAEFTVSGGKIDGTVAPQGIIVIY